MKQPNLILAGFMGTGKTTVGREIARRTGREFLDIDQLIETELGLSVREIFTRYGEPFFREQERRVIAGLATRRGVVIAVGGGALLDATNRAMLAATGTIVCLEADEATLLARLSADPHRPLLAGDTPAARLRALLSARAAHYASFPLRVNTTGRSVNEVVDQVLQVVATAEPSPIETIPVNTPAARYTVYLAPGLLCRAGSLLHDLGLTGRVAIVTDPVVHQLHVSTLAQSLTAAGFDPVIVEVPGGEATKTLTTVAQLYRRFLALRLDRSSPVLAMGGGVVSDVAGFAAATFWRGLPLVQVPTTLVAMVDASIGGKTGVNLPQGKNLVGVFYQPRTVLCDPATLTTLPPVELRCGLAEVVKTAVIADPLLFATLEAAGCASPSTQIVRDAARVKAAIVAADPFEQGERITLNLGHTIGHALEVASHFRYRHGEAVSVGLVGAARLAAELGFCSPEVTDRVERLLKRIGLPVAYTGPKPAAVLARLKGDKKHRQGRLRWVLPVAIGKVVVTEDVPPEKVRAVVAGLWQATIMEAER